SGESVDHRIPPMRVALTAVYNTFQAVDVWRVRRDDRWVTPPRGLNFGPVEKGETQTRTFTVRSLFAAGGAYWSGACESG
ncbi:Putative peptidase C1-like protein, partial [Durusdinium trenchii]